MHLRRSSAALYCLGRRPASSAKLAAPAVRGFHLALGWLSLVVLSCVASANAATINVPADQPSIQAGINAANNGDIVLVSPGTYYENIDFKGKAITVTSSGGSAVTTIDGGTQSATVHFVTGETRSSILSNLTITGGLGLYYTTQGGIYIRDSGPSILNNVIRQAQCYGINSQASYPLIQGNEITDTQAQPYECSFASGAGIWLSDIFIPAVPVVEGNIIEYNTHSGLEDAGGNGGGGIAVWGAAAVIQNNIIRYNATGKFPSPAGGGSGGGIYFSGAAGLVVNNLIYGNTSNLGGGGIYLADENIGISAPLVLINNTIVDNAIVPVTVSQAVLGGEQLYYAGGNNPAYTVNLTFANNIVSGSTANPSVVCSDGTINPVVFTNNDFYNATGPVTGVYQSGTCTFPVGTSGNISASPVFVQPSSQDYHIVPTSPTVDAGDNSSLQLAAAQGVAATTDLDGNPRIQNATGKGCIVDMGAFETSGTPNACGTTVNLQSSLDPSFFNQAVTFTATLTSTLSPSGNIVFSDGATILASQPLVPISTSSGSASFTTNALSVGTHPIGAAYVPGGTLPAGSAALTQTVLRLTTAATITSSLNPSSFGQSVTFTATVTNTTGGVGAPGGIFTFFDGTSLLGTLPVVALGTTYSTASFSTSTLSIGTHTITAVYTPSTNFSPASTSLLQVVGAAGAVTTTTLASSLNPAPYNQPVTFTATVTNTSATGAPTGTITFSDGATVLATQPVTSTSPTAAIASFSSSTLTAGTHTITATYSPAAGFSGSTATLTQNITGLSTTTAIASSSNPANAGLSITFTATITNTSTTAGTPAGTITFSDGPTILATQPVTANNATTATASFSTSTLAIGSHSITATYTPTGAFSSSSAVLTQVINALASVTTLTAAPNPANFGQTVTLVAGVSGAVITGGAPIPTGTVTFYDGATLLASTPIISGQATITTATLTVGAHSLTAVYSGNVIYSPSTSLPFTEIIQALPQDFTLTLAQPTITIQTQHHTTTSLTLASLNGFTDSIALGCVNPPTYVTCRFTPASSPLAANSTATVSLYLDTDSVLGYAHLQSAPPPAHRTPSTINLALLLSPIGLVAAFTRRRNKRLTGLRLLLLLLAAIPISATLTGCGEIIYPFAIPPSATPGTYTLQIVASGATTGVTHTANLTLQITP
jgi:hypothetical protein